MDSVGLLKERLLKSDTLIRRYKEMEAELKVTQQERDQLKDANHSLSGANQELQQALTNALNQKGLLLIQVEESQAEREEAKRRREEVGELREELREQRELYQILLKSSNKTKSQLEQKSLEVQYFAKKTLELEILKKKLERQVEAMHNSRRSMDSTEFQLQTELVRNDGQQQQMQPLPSTNSAEEQDPLEQKNLREIFVNIQKERMEEQLMKSRQNQNETIQMFTSQKLRPKDLNVKREEEQEDSEEEDVHELEEGELNKTSILGSFQQGQDEFGRLGRKQESDTFMKELYGGEHQINHSRITGQGFQESLGESNIGKRRRDRSQSIIKDLHQRDKRAKFTNDLVVVFSEPRDSFPTLEDNSNKEFEIVDDAIANRLKEQNQTFSRGIVKLEPQYPTDYHRS